VAGGLEAEMLNKNESYGLSWYKGAFKCTIVDQKRRHHRSNGSSLTQLSLVQNSLKFTCVYFSCSLRATSRTEDVVASDKKLK